MSHLRAPAARADRREGGRHGRPVARPVPSLPETHIRPQLLRLAVLPPIAVALSASAAVLFTVRSTGARPSLTLWGVLAGAAAVAFAGILIASVAADRTAKSVSDRLGALRRISGRGEADLRALVESLRRGDTPPPRKPRSSPPDDADDFELLAADLTRAHDGAVTAVVQAAQLSSQAGSEQKLEVFVNLARRLQSLVHREISILDELENEIEDPDLLKGLFHVDHLATRIRRHAENLAVLGGAVSRRQWSNPVSMTEVLRSAIAEVEQYSRVKLVPPIDGTLRGHAVADVIHLLAELVENATVFSAPHTQVLLRANLVTSGLAVEVEDRGLGMPVGEQKKMNALLADPDQVNVASLLADGRIGLFVVSQLARRHGINVRLQTNIYGGVQAVLVVPQGLLGSTPGVPGGAGQPHSVTGVMGMPEPSVPPRSQPQAPPGPPSETVGPRVAPPPPSQSTAAVSNGSPLGGTAAGSGAAPLPVRAAHEERANPAEALPGIRPEDRRLVAENAGTPPTPRTAAVRGTMGKPQLPRRRAQEHIAPQLRDGPAPRQESEYLAGHDPGLMAAFQRGIGLAEAQQNLESESTEYAEHPEYTSEYTGAVHTASSARLEPDHMASPHMEAPHMGASHMESGPTESAPTESAYMAAEPMEQTARIESRPRTDPARTDGAPNLPSSPLDVLHTDVTATTPPPSIDVSHMDAAHIAEARPASARGTDHPSRHDGSAPAG
ncbi:ATP-binding protein [Streptomyces sp. NPDC001604]|uniref:sensor histidine kinase n=1 Tax=Streptomyces sp. NPDC001604 TaxID=3364593 RepID=UPI0036BF9A6C